MGFPPFGVGPAPLACLYYIILDPVCQEVSKFPEMRRKTPCFSRGECQEILWSEYAGWDFVEKPVSGAHGTYQNCVSGGNGGLSEKLYAVGTYPNSAV